MRSLSSLPRAAPNLPLREAAQMPGGFIQRNHSMKTICAAILATALASPALGNDPRPREAPEDYGPRAAQPYKYPTITNSTVVLPTKSKWGYFDDFGGEYGWELSPYSWVEPHPGRLDADFGARVRRAYRQFRAPQKH